MLALPLLLLLSAAPEPAIAPATPAEATPAAAAAPATAPAATIWDVAKGSTISCHVVHKFHAVDEVTRAVEGKARLSPEGDLDVSIRAPVASFDSGNSNRDAHMLEVTEAARFPWVSLKGGATGVRVVAAGDVDVPLRAELDLHGVQREVDVTAHVHFASPGHAEVQATFPVSLTAHRVKRPSLLFVKIEDQATVTARLVLDAEAPQPRL